MATSIASSDPDITANDEQLSNDYAVSLFNSYLRKALQQQNEVIVISFVKQLKSRPNEHRANTSEDHEEPEKSGQFDFKHEGHRIQHLFDAERLEKLSELKNLIAQNDLGKAERTIYKEIAKLRQRNKIIVENQILTLVRLVNKTHFPPMTFFSLQPNVYSRSVQANHKTKRLCIRTTSIL